MSTMAVSGPRQRSNQSGYGVLGIGPKGQLMVLVRLRKTVQDALEAAGQLSAGDLLDFDDFRLTYRYPDGTWVDMKLANVNGMWLPGRPVRD